MSNLFKRIVAKEILIIFSLAGVVLITLIGIELYNYSKKSTLEGYIDKAREIKRSGKYSDYYLNNGNLYSFIYLYNFYGSDTVKFNSFIEKYKFDIAVFFDNEIYGEIALKDSLGNRFDDLFNKGAIAPVQYEKNYFKEDPEKEFYKNLDQIDTEFILKVSIIILLFTAYPFRGAILLIKWSIRTLKNP